MTIRTRKFFGTIALLVLVVVWSLLGMTIAQTPWLADSGLRQAIFYVVAGLGWVLPAMPIVSWMSRPDRAADQGRVLVERRCPLVRPDSRYALVAREFCLTTRSGPSSSGLQVMLPGIKQRTRGWPSM